MSLSACIILVCFAYLLATFSAFCALLSSLLTNKDDDDDDDDDVNWTSNLHEGNSKQSTDDGNSVEDVPQVTAI